MASSLGRCKHVVVENSRVRGLPAAVLRALGDDSVLCACVPGPTPALSWVDLSLQLPAVFPVLPEPDGLVFLMASQGQDWSRLLVKAS